MPHTEHISGEILERHVKTVKQDLRRGISKQDRDCDERHPSSYWPTDMNPRDHRHDSRQLGVWESPTFILLGAWMARSSA
jgi:hypothetical protein